MEGKADPVLARIGRRIQRLRDQAGMTQEELAKKVGSHKNSVSRHENGDRNVGVLDLLAYANALGVTLDDLCCRNVSALEDQIIARSESLYFLDPAALLAARKAKHIEDISDHFDAGIDFGSEVPPSFVVTTAEQFGQAQLEIDRHVNRLGGIPAEWGGKLEKETHAESRTKTTRPDRKLPKPGGSA